MKCRFLLIIAWIALLSLSIEAAPSLTFHTSNCDWRIQPETLALHAEDEAKKSFDLAAGFSFPSKIEELLVNDTGATWKLPEQGLEIQTKILASGGIEFSIRTEKPQIVQWPIVELDRSRDELIWPKGQGCIFPISDAFWTKFVFSRDWNTLEDLSLPLWGIKRENQIVSWTVDSPFRNTIHFETESSIDRLVFQHDFNKKSPEKVLTFRIYIDKNVSPIQPALHYRDWLKETGQFVTMEEKVKETPNADCLRGAIHAYIWGDTLISSHDIMKNQWKPFCQQLLREAATQSDSVSAWIHTFSSAESWAAVTECAKTEWPYIFLRTQVTLALSQMLQSDRFSESPVWQTATLSKEVQERFDRRQSLSPEERIFLHSSLLAAAFPNVFLNPRDWGDGVSLKMLKKIQESGIKKIRLCTEGWNGIEKRPWVAEEANRLEWLIGTYDSYHSVHDPKDQGKDSTWETAQMTQELFEQGSVMSNDGTYPAGFKGIGRHLNSIVGRTFVEERIGSIMSKTPFNYYFLDCDAYGEVFDDYHPDHPLSMEDDAATRCARMEWVSAQFNTVVGAEGGNAYFIPSLHVAEGILGPFFGWDEPDMKDPSSHYFRGKHWPPDEPQAFFKAIPIKKDYQTLNYDPRYRLPLHASAFHDAAVITHHWSNGHFKYPEIRPLVALTEILYLCPPLYHFNLNVFDEMKELILEHYRIWSPLHLQYGFESLTAFRWLSNDRSVQETTFGTNCRIVVNFGAVEFKTKEFSVPPQSAWIDAPTIWETPIIYTPSITRLK